MRYEYAQVSIKNINSGAITELFNAELPKVLENIADDNTKPDAPREIRLIIKIKPTKDRAQAATEISVVTKLAPIKPHEGSITFSLEEDGVKAYTIADMDQPELENIRHIGGGK